MGELRDWLAVHEVSPAQASEVEAALGRITLRLIREAEAEAGRAGSVGPAGFAVAVQPCGLTWRRAYVPGTVPRQVKVASAPPGSV